MPPAKLSSRIALVAIGLLVGLVAGELLARLLGPAFQVVFRDSIAPSDDPVLGYELRPGAPDGKRRINSAGMRDREFELAKPRGVWRIAAIGDSISHGSGVSQDGAYPKQLEALLEAARTDAAPRIEVLNFGVPGYNVEQVAARLRRRADAFEPDAVLYGYALNDPQAFSIEAEALRRLRSDVEPARSARGLERWLAHSRLYLLGRRVALERRSRAALRADMPNDPAYEAAKSGDPARYFHAIHATGESAARLAAGLDAIAAFGRERRVPVLVAVFPLFGGSGVEPRALADVHARVIAAARERGLAALDLLPVYEAATTAFGSALAVDFMHPDAIGHRVAAFALLEWMCGAGWPAPGALACDRASASPSDAAIARVVRRSLDRGGAAPR